MQHLPRTIRTLRHLRPGQVWHRARRRVIAHLSDRPLHVPEQIELRDDWPEFTSSAAAVGEGECGNWFADLERGRFTHLNQTKQLAADAAAIDWQLGPATRDRLWTVTLHYHAWAERLATIVADQGGHAHRADELLRRYLADWLHRCDLDQPGARHLAWNAYAVATRIGHWVRLWLTLGPSGRQQWGDLEPAFLRSLYKQAAFLARNLEWDLRANHLMRDAVGLAWAGRFFRGDQPARWLATATRIATQQAAEQVLPDGGHFERSPMYHLQIMSDIAILAALTEDSAARDRLRETWQRMADFAIWARHPDGHIPLLNDAAFNGAASPAGVLQQGAHLLDTDLDLDLTLPRGSSHFKDFGLAIHHSPTWSVFFDVGPVGVDYQPGHAHADTLTLEASFRGRRLVVDPGVYAYDHDDRRREDRSTAAHNTVCVDDENSSEVWHIFRVGRRARPLNVTVADTTAGFRAAAAHDGYHHLPGRPTHRREVAITPDAHLRIADQITGSGEHAVEGGLLIAPGWQVQRIADATWRLVCDDRRVTLSFAARQPLTCADEPAVYHPEFGCELTTRRLTWRYQGPLPLRVQTVIAEQTARPANAAAIAQSATRTSSPA